MHESKMPIVGEIICCIDKRLGVVYATDMLPDNEREGELEWTVRIRMLTKDGEYCHNNSTRKFIMRDKKTLMVDGKRIPLTIFVTKGALAEAKKQKFS